MRVERVVVLGRGASGKTTFARRLKTATGLPLVELDVVFWGLDLQPTPPREWATVTAQMAARSHWIMDGDLGPYDVLAPRLSAADTVVLLDLSLVRCGWRAVRRSRERRDFWWWTVSYRRRWLPLVKEVIDAQARDADVHVLRSPRAVDRFLAELEHGRGR